LDLGRSEIDLAQRIYSPTLGELFIRLELGPMKHPDLYFRLSLIWLVILVGGAALMLLK
jgi:hypothetical protein